MSEKGYIGAILGSEIGRASLALGAGRLRKEDSVDPAVGIVMTRRIGEWVDKGEPLAYLHVTRRSNVEAAQALASRAIALSREPVETPPLIYASVEGKCV